MTDETTARDRAIERIAESIDWQPTCLPGNERRTIVRQVLDMAEHPRALAGAPTADVASLVAKYRAKSAEFLEDWQDWDAHDGHERCGQGIAYSDVADELETLVAAAPEGVDAADEHDEAWKLRETIRLLQEAGAELANELTAAQAAIQRVRDEIDAAVAGTISPAVAVTNIVRALDGDTTEEKR